MKRSSLPNLWRLSAVLLLGAVVGSRREPRSDLTCRNREAFRRDSCCDAGSYPVTQKGGLCEPCGKLQGCKRGLYCRLEYGDVGRCVPVNYAGRATRRLGAGLCEICGTYAGIRCDYGLYCFLTSKVGYDRGVCLPRNDVGPVYPPNTGNVCGPCGAYVGGKCKSGLECRITGVDEGICIPTHGPGSGTYGRRCGVCGPCGPWSNCRTGCLPGLHCEYAGNPTHGGICTPDKEPPCCERSGLCGDCGGCDNIQCKPGLCCRLEVGSDSGKCVPRSYAGPHCDYRKDHGVCEFCGGIAAIPCLPGLDCLLVGNYPDAGGVCVPQKEPVNPRGNTEICGFCGLFGKLCKPGLYCKRIGRDDGICLPINGDDTYGQKCGVCGTCGAFGDCRTGCLRDLHCEYTDGNVDHGVCIPNKGPVKPPKGNLCGACGYYVGGECKPGLFCKLTGVDEGVCLPHDQVSATYGQKCGVCGTCGPRGDCHTSCLQDMHCDYTSGNIDRGLCIPNNGTNLPPESGICGFCGGFAAQMCKHGLYCHIIGGDFGKCVPTDGPGFGTFGHEGGVCGTCDYVKNKCLPGFHCEHADSSGVGICIPNSGSWKCDPRKGEEYTDCGSACPPTCANYTNTGPCILPCVYGCFCPTGTVRRESDRNCVKPEECNFKCDPKKGEKYQDFGSHCFESCDTYLYHLICPQVLYPGCFCPKGKYRRKIDDYCVEPGQCLWK